MVPVSALIYGVISKNEMEVMEEEEESRKQPTVLIIVSTDVEVDALAASAKTLTGNDYSHESRRARSYMDFGTIGGSHCIGLQVEMGSTAPGASATSTLIALDELKPETIFLTGLAFGVDARKQHIGQVLVSKQLQLYNLQKIGTDTKDGSPKITLRDSKPHCTPSLLSKLHSTRPDWKESTVKFGLLLSGEKLVDNVDYRDDLKKLVPEAIGGEMEGAGVYAASLEKRADWVVVKAICDFADGKKRYKKEEKQKLAAKNATQYVLRTIARGGF